MAKRKRRISDEIKPCQIKTLITLNIRNKITLACVKFNYSSYFLLLQATIFPNIKKRPKNYLLFDFTGNNVDQVSSSLPSSNLLFFHADIFWREILC